MGVLGLYSWIVKNYSCSLAVLNGDEELGIDNLYLDFNTFIYSCINDKCNDPEKLTQKWYKNIEKRLDETITRTKPKNLIYIAVDGVPPKAKMKQQRSRRVKKANNMFDKNNMYFNEDVKIMNQEIKCCFDSNSFKPGTVMMDKIDKILTDLIKNKLKNDKLWKDKIVIYSSYKVPGEGEHKIMNYLRAHKKDSKENHVIYSPDGDLIFLGLSLPDYNIKILKEERRFKWNKDTKKKTFIKKDFVTININRLTDCMFKQMVKEIKTPVISERLISDLIFLCSCLGNDFMSPIKGFSVKTNGINKISKNLVATYLKCKNYITRPDRQINYDVLKSYFDVCKESVEKEKAIRQELLTKDLENPDHSYSKKDKKRMARRRKRNAVRNNEEKTVYDPAIIADMCNEYIKSMVWVYQYYYDKCPSWNYYYPYLHAPLLNNLVTNKINEVSFEESKPLTPFEQLLCVLPPMSMDLLPEPLRGYYYDNEMIIVKEEYSCCIKNNDMKGYLYTYNEIYNATKNKKLKAKDIFIINSHRRIQSADNDQTMLAPKLAEDKALIDYVQNKQGELNEKEKERNKRGQDIAFTNKSEDADKHHNMIYIKQCQYYTEEYSDFVNTVNQQESTVRNYMSTPPISNED